MSFWFWRVWPIMTRPAIVERNEKMAKFYVRSGQIEEVVVADNHKDAATRVLVKFLDKFENAEELKQIEALRLLGMLTSISERGFDAGNEDDYLVMTASILNINM